MPWEAPILGLAVVLLPVVLAFEKTGNRRGLVPAKTTLSLLFILAALAQETHLPRYSQCVMAGLALCLLGDFFLALPQRTAFMAGLVAFLAGHVLYVLAFLPLARAGVLLWSAGLVFVLASAWVFLWLRPHLGSMRGPVLAYVVVITAMVSSAAGVLGNQELNITGRLMVFTGAVLFYISDVFVARDRFVSRGFTNRLLGLPTYYAGQFLLAFSLGAVSFL